LFSVLKKLQNEMKMNKASRKKCAPWWKIQYCEVKWKRMKQREMVFCYQNCSDLLWEKIVLVIEKNFWRPRICKIFEITRIICSNSERSEEFLVIECFFKLFLEVSQNLWIRTIQIQIGKNYWDLETCRKS
jgi:hypothetical protein